MKFLFKNPLVKFVSVYACFLALCGSLAIASPTQSTKGKFIITCFDMPDIHRGAGLAIVLQTPDGHTYLIDTGVGYPSTSDASGWASNFNAGRDLIAPFLRQHNIKEIDGVAISHAHLDHYGGLLWLVDHFPIKMLYDSGYEYPGKVSPVWQDELGGYTKLRNVFKARGEYQEAHAGDKLDWGPLLDVEVLAPPKKYFSEVHPDRYSPGDVPEHYLVNSNSLDLRIRYGKVVFLFPGDIQKGQQVESLLPSVPPEKLRADILIAPGHGIDTAQTPEFAAAVRPKVVIASLTTPFVKGTTASKIYGQVGAKVYITALQGWIRVICDGKHYKVETERTVQPHISNNSRPKPYLRGILGADESLSIPSKAGSKTLEG